MMAHSLHTGALGAVTTSPTCLSDIDSGTNFIMTNHSARERARGQACSDNQDAAQFKSTCCLGLPVGCWLLS